MKKNNAGFMQIILTLVVVALVGGGMYYYGKVSNKSGVIVEIPTEEPVVVETQKPSTPTVKPTSDPTANWKTYNFQPLKLTLKVPTEFTVKSSEPNPGDDFTAYIQNKAFNEGLLESSYQLYIVWQKMKVSAVEMKNLKLELNPSSVSESIIDGYSVISGQIKGDRNRFVSYILWNDTKISLYTSQPTEENREITDQILSTFKFTK